MTPLRIAHIILSRGFAGSERATVEMCNAHAHTHRVMLIIRRSQATRTGVSLRPYVDPAVEVVEAGNWVQRWRIAAALKEFQPDVIHAHLRRSTRMLARVRPAAPTIATLHLTVNGPHFVAMDGLICIAHWQTRDIPPDYPGRVYFINESLIPNRRVPPDELAGMRRELGVAPDEFLVGGVGRLARSKGFDILIEAFRRAALPGARLVILGEGRERKRLEKLCAPAISLPGFRSNVKDYYQLFDVFVSPSRSEPLGRVVIEALDAGVPVIASRTLGPTEILTQYPGDQFPIGDVEGLAELLRRHHAQRVPHRQHDLSQYHLDNVARETELAYRELIALRRTRRGTGP